MQRSNPWQSYRTVATQTASPAQLILMLYEGAIRFLEKGLTGFNSTDPLEFNLTINNNILRAQAIIQEMNANLNMDQGGEISTNFRRLYDYLHSRLQEANVKKQREPVVEVISRLNILRDSWAEMIQKNSSGTPPNNAPAGAGLLQAA